MKKSMLIILFFIFSISILLLLLILTSFSPRDRAVLFQPLRIFKHDGEVRTYLLSTPKKIDKETRIFVGLHGFTDSARRFAYYTSLHNAVGVDDIVIYPNAISPKAGQLSGWNAGFCCGSGREQGVDDAGFIVELVSTVQNEYGIENAKTYVVGFSNGGFMAQKVAIEHSEVISSAAVVSGAIGTQEQKLVPGNPMPILLIHGEQDGRIPYAGGAALSDPGFKWLPFEEMKASWEKVNKNNVSTSVILHPELGHSWKGWRIANFWNKTPETSRAIIRFFDSL
jgi:polyhydroxybutyrate depolymerase